MTYTGTERINEFFLAHHGIKGQKWGRRRWQNEDGTLTEEGRKRYEKYAKQLGYKLGEKNKSKAASSFLKGAAASSVFTNSGIKAAMYNKVSRDLLRSGEYDLNERVAIRLARKKAIKQQLAVGIGSILAGLSFRKKRRFLQKYADAYGGENIDTIKSAVKKDRKAFVAGAVVGVPATVLGTPLFYGIRARLRGE